MASTVPAKSQALHGFALPHLKWNKDNHSNGQHRRRRSIKSPSLESHPSSGSPLREPSRQSPLHDSASATLVQSQLSVLAESTMSPVRDDLMKYSPLRGESSKQSPLQNSAKQSPLPRESVKQSLKHNLASESEASMTNKSILIEYHRNHLKNSVSETNRNGRYLSNLDRATEKSKKKLKATEADSSATKEKRSRILLKIPRENESEENQQEEPHKIDNNLDEDVEAAVSEYAETVK
ncbi:Uncharacterized protein Adt_39731 [Abeliophyllum distichum]|uniref:Uncharacterized protein n=1 Tax=Abeliophyllum distichum TaxID=126358 RepID=A0ABD1Q645_9LAMI